METLAIETRSLTKEYQLRSRTIEVLRGVDLTVPAGQWITLTGKSGCGKTTLLRILGALDDPKNGRVICFGTDVVDMNRFEKARLRRDRLGFIFQSYHLFSELDALENVLLPGRLANGDFKSKRERALHLLSLFGMDNRQRHRPAELSGGEQQRVAIARALMNQPDIILADEPTGNLDDKNSDEIMVVLRQLRDDQGKTIIMVTHNRSLARYSDKTYVLTDGVIVPAEN